MSFSDKIMERFRELKKAEFQDIDPEVKDNRLTSLRKQRQKQINEIEKRQLQRDIKAYNEKENEKFLGFKRKPSKNMLKEKRKFLVDSKPLMKQKNKKVKNMFIK